jgi:hypothetical protein
VKPRSPQAATYLFCLVESARTPSLRGVPESVPGAGPARLIPIDPGVWAVVADAPLDRFSEERLKADLQDLEAVSRHALAHASVIEFFFRRSPVIPLKMLTLFSADDRLREHLAGRRPKLRRLFAELRGLEEWGVRVFTAEPRLRAADAIDSGRDYLEAKKRMSEPTRPSRAAIADASKTLKALGRLATKKRKDEYPRGAAHPYVAGASFLVSIKKRAQWKRLAARLGQSLAARGHRLEVSGPWPPYHFARK